MEPNRLVTEDEKILMYLKKELRYGRRDGLPL